MIGYIVRHRQLGLGKILSAQHRAFSIRFVGSDQVLPLGAAEMGKGGSLVRAVLQAGSRCRTPQGDCLVDHVARRPTDPGDPYTYIVALEGGGESILSEVDLQPIAGGEAVDPQVQIEGLQLQPYSLFANREKLRRAYARMLRDASGLKALLGSRVDLRPHQAFVAATVILDPHRRFILADEVGLGKTIEAGIVMHDLMAQKPDARILVLCPGALTQQWLCELYSKFGGHVFTLLDLHNPEVVDWRRLRHAITSTTTAAFEITNHLKKVPWDMLVVDEVHHLLRMPAVYSLVESLSSRASSVLLLSAIPAHERTEDLLRLLALVEPGRHQDLSPAAQERFARLHQQQPIIGRGLRVLGRRIDLLEAGEIDVNEVLAVATRLLETDVLNSDTDLRTRLDQVRRMAEHVGGDPSTRGVILPAPTLESRFEVVEPEHGGQASPDLQETNGRLAMPVGIGSLGSVVADASDAAGLVGVFRRLAHDTADRYRLSRRILRNRRARLIELKQIVPIERRAELQAYGPHRLELEAVEALESLLRSAQSNDDSDLERDLLAAFARVAWQAASSPRCLVKLLAFASRVVPQAPDEITPDFLTIGQDVGYSDWVLYTDLLVSVVRPRLSDDLLAEAVRSAVAWQDAGPEACARLGALERQLHIRVGVPAKLIVFAGFPELLSEVTEFLTGTFGAGSVATFSTTASMEEKEANALRFQQDSATWILASDESGGEGRNFQFATGIIHFDTPWNVARIEQRIGRLDRLGRERVSTEVISTVLYNDASVEAGLVHCYHDALGVYTHSISGLEFGLREVERTIVSNALAGGIDGLFAGASALAAVVARERERDESDAVLDEASYESASAERFRAMAQSDRADAGLEQPMYEYVRQLTEGRGVRRLDTPFGPGAVVRFQPEKTSFGALPVDEGGADFLAGNFDGTFRRSVAQAVPHLHFFNVGDPLFNGVIRSLDRHVTGRTFGVELVASERLAWVGLECRFIPEASSMIGKGPPGLRNRSDAIFIPKPLAVLIDFHGLLCPDADLFVALRRRLENAQHGQTWWDLVDADQQWGGVFDGSTWPSMVSRLITVARSEARRLLDKQLTPVIASEQARVGSIVEVLTASAESGDEGASLQARDYANYSAALSQWSVTLDAVGVLSINGKVRLGGVQ